MSVGVTLPRRIAATAVLLLILLSGAAGAQAPSGAAPLRDESGDWWGDVHRWTGSDATRPRRGAEPPARSPAPPAREGASAGPAGDGTRVITSATTRANIRREPSSSAGVVRVLGPGTTLQVLGEAPGGWLQVSEGEEPIGWIHRSVLQPR